MELFEESVNAFLEGNSFLLHNDFNSHKLWKKLVLCNLM